jgi:hypothetical protein
MKIQTATNGLRFRIQLQPSKQTQEEGAKRLFPSSFGISFPVAIVNIASYVEVDSVAEQAIIQRCPQSKYLDFLIVQIRCESCGKLECFGHANRKARFR